MARLAAVGLFVLAGLLLFSVGLFMIGDRQMAFSRTFPVSTQFDRVTGLQPGALVRVAGARAGTIRRIDPPRDPSGRFRVELEIMEDLRALVRTDSLVTIEAEGLVGGSYLGVAIGSADAPVADTGAILPSREPFGMSDMLMQMSQTVVKVNATVDVLTAQMQQTLDSLVVTVDNVNSVISDVSDDATVMARSGARISADLAEITAQVRRGHGTVGRLLTDDQLYASVATTVDRGEAIVADVQHIVRDLRATVEQLRSGQGAVGLTSDFRQTLAEAREAMSGFADNMDALKRNFLFRGFFNRRGYFDLQTLSPDAYRNGALSSGGNRSAVRVWLTADVLFDRPSDAARAPTAMTDDGRRRLVSAVSTFLDRLPAGVLMVEGYSRMGASEDRYRTARARAAVARDYLIAHFGLDPERTGLMPLGDIAMEAPPIAAWNGEGVALAFFADSASR